MQCTNCGFQNMPGSDVCGRCATSLRLATAVIDVHPPRAGAMTKRIRQILPVRRAYFGARAALIAGGASDLRIVDDLTAFPALSRLILPGWSHAYLGQNLRGTLLFLAWAACALPAFVLFGSTWGSVWLGLAFSVHSSAGLDIVTQTFADAGVRDRMARSIVVSVVLWLLVYWPALWLIGGIAGPHTIRTPLGPFQSGDVLRVNRWKTPQRGQVVLYQADWEMTDDGHRRVHETDLYNGENVDRILAVPGDSVECKAGQLTVNGLPSQWHPLNPRRLPDEFNWIVPGDHYLILPSELSRVGALDNPNTWKTTGSVARDDIAGCAWLQSLPLARMHLIR